jgi:hypothetical protein
MHIAMHNFSHQTGARRRCIVKVATVGYRRRKVEDQAKAVVLTPREEPTAIDAWAIPARNSSRLAAIRLGVKKGHEALTNSPADSAG